MPITWLADISHWQGDISIPRLAVDFKAIVCKATEGRDYRDPKFAGNIAAIRKTTAIGGAYHYLRSSDGHAQAEHFVKRLRDTGGFRDLVIQLDVESDGKAAQMRDWTEAWNELTGRHPFAIYSGSWWWKPRVGAFAGKVLTPYLWHSHYVSGSDTAVNLYKKVPASWWTPGYGGWPSATILQFSSKATHAGKKIDVNAFRGTPAQLASTFTRTAPPPPRPTPPAPKPPARTHTVQRGDTLSKISQQHYGTMSKWDDIYRANRDTIEREAREHGHPDSNNGSLIFGGTVLRLP